VQIVLCKLSMKSYWHITNRCNLNCFHCYMNSGKYYIEENIPEILDWHKNNKSIHDIVITGGEPLLIESLKDIIWELSFSGKNVILYTNGLLLNNQKISQLKNVGLQKIRISIDSALMPLNGRTITFKKAIEIGKTCVKGGISYELGVTIIPNINDNIKHILPIKEACFENNFMFSISPYFPSNQDEKLLPLTQSALSILMEFKYFNNIMDKINNSGKMNYNNTRCSALRDVVAILPDGKISPCDNLAGAIRSERSILDYDLDFIVENEKKLNFFKNYTITELKTCSSCQYLSYCKGGCRAIAFYYKNEVDCDIFTKQKYTFCFERYKNEITHNDIV
jgi:radical SAM protein with 4Fe4S-binding SPASM domain